MNIEKKTKLGHGIVVYNDGRVYQKGKKCAIEYEIFDQDVNLRIPTYPYIYYEYRNHWKKTETAKIDVQDLMVEAGYVDGNKHQFKDPVILHKDGDYMNCSSDNLEWCDATDPRYIEYSNKTTDTIVELAMQRNKNWLDFID